MKRRPQRTHMLVATILIGTLSTSSVFAQVATASSEPAETVTPVAPVTPKSAGVAVSSRGNIAMSYSLGMPGQAPIGTALLVLTGEVDAGQIETLTEDLNIMCRVFDRQTNRASSRPQGYDIFIHSPAGSPANHFFGAYSPSTHCLYIQDHGPLFFISVNFPLVAPTESDETMESEGPSDPVWQEVAKDLYNPSSERPHRRQAEPAPYDRQKVLTLENNIITSLKHAANIRDLKANELVTVVVRSREGAPQDPYGMALFENSGMTAKPGPTLVMCATVKDIKDYAAGTLSQPEFDPRVQTLVR